MIDENGNVIGTTNQIIARISEAVEAVELSFIPLAKDHLDDEYVKYLETVIAAANKYMQVIGTRANLQDIEIVKAYELYDQLKESPAAAPVYVHLNWDIPVIGVTTIEVPVKEDDLDAAIVLYPDYGPA